MSSLPNSLTVRFTARLAEGGIGHIARNQDAAAPFRFHRRFGVFGVFMFIEIDDGNIGAFARIENGDGAADTGIAAGDEGRHVLEFFGSLIPRRLEKRFLLEIRFEPGLRQMLRRKAIGIVALTRLHGTLVGFRRAAFPIPAINLSLYFAAFVDDGFGRIFASSGRTSHSCLPLKNEDPTVQRESWFLAACCGHEMMEKRGRPLPISASAERP